MTTRRLQQQAVSYQVSHLISHTLSYAVWKHTSYTCIKW